VGTGAVHHAFAGVFARDGKQSVKPLDILKDFASIPTRQPCNPGLIAGPVRPLRRLWNHAEWRLHVAARAGEFRTCQNSSFNGG
jgi:hypothetical protein